MLKNYLYTIGLYLPVKQRNEILKDIEASVYEILEKKYGVKDYSVDEIKQVIIDFGNPKQVAENYLGETLTFISSDLFNEYFLALKIALFGGNIGILVANFIKIDASSINITYIISLLEELVQTSLSIFGLITLIFYLVNRAIIKEKVVSKDIWSIDSLKELIEDKDKVERFELGIESVFLIILTFGLFNFIINLGSWFNQIVLVVFYIFIAISLILNLYLIIKGKWQKPTRIISIGLDLIFTFCVIQFYLSMDKIDSSIDKIDLSLLNNSGVVISVRLAVIFILAAITYDTFKHIRRLIID